MESSSILGGLCFVIIAIGCIGNIFVIFVLLKDRKTALSGSINLLLLNLAFADLGNLVSCSADLAVILLACGWFLPTFLCPFLHFLEEFFLYASVLMQLAIGVERYMAICSPLKLHRIPREMTLILVPIIWFSAGLFTLPYVLYHRVASTPPQCVWTGLFWRNRRLRFVYKVLECVMFYFAPMIILTVLYAHMSLILWGSRVGETAASEQVLKLRKAVIKMLIISLVLYFICYSPMQGLFIATAIFRWSVNVSMTVRLIFNALSFSSSSANPIVYIVCCQHFRNRFWTVIRYCCPFCNVSRYSTVSLEMNETTGQVANSRFNSFRHCKMEM
uniref:G_PROTEIN_RECEP_F1_2 domain-containing protein n=1 Tax=Syphacia muris TaxID=451379 RepID=A0A158R5F2_9BILA